MGGRLRFNDPFIKADEFEGIALVDELELHLHPEWQSKITGIFKQIFPKIQFFGTTHSPHVIQHALPNEIVALAREEGRVVRRELPSGKRAFLGWTVEEILVDVMGMRDTRTEYYHSAIQRFDHAIGAEDYHAAQASMDDLNDLLHPENNLRKLLKFQLSAIQSLDDD